HLSRGQLSRTSLAQLYPGPQAHRGPRPARIGPRRPRHPDRVILARSPRPVVIITGREVAPFGGTAMKSLVTTAALALLLPAGLPADEKDDALAAQRKAAKENWDRVDAGPSVTHETDHLFLVAPKGMEKQLKETGILLEKFYDTSAKFLFPPKEPAWPGKLAVYLFEQPEQLDSFIRRVEKRRVVGVEKGTFRAEDMQLHAAACPPREKGDPAVRLQAGQQIASAVLMRKAGAKTIVPGWLVAGFGRATSYRVVGSA